MLGGCEHESWEGFPNWYKDKDFVLQSANLPGGVVVGNMGAYKKDVLTKWFSSKNVYPHFLFPNGEPINIDRWAKESAWTLSEFADLCCGLEPNKGRPNTVAYNEAREKISRAVLMGDLCCKEPGDAQEPANLLYGTNRFFLPKTSAEWAANRFERFPCISFPNTEKAQNQPEENDLHVSGGLDQSVVDRLQVMMNAANYFWGEKGCADNSTTNVIVGKWIGKEADVSPTMCENMARIIRPNYAKKKTWADNMSPKHE
jgi:hypothetical protein